MPFKGLSAFFLFCRADRRWGIQAFRNRPDRERAYRKGLVLLSNYYQPEIERASREQIKAWQDERLVETVNHVYKNVPYYRLTMEEKMLSPADI